ncbi:hypothetical protein A8H35_05805 [Burkholderia thailandensis]|nr:hypothetical protein A8H31_17475 [Burkholderia thailandensis]AVR24750.1 hypothetical protein A8H32_06065 [Burkholderia thailandensis]AWY58026.1 hypothetical protein A8H35_05805 [Burkholderia thailandensis]AWY67800.1 hypothetical protein A8H36_22525 [Burkholderia thailandensis]NOK41452.1 hypothetical protein [Burkholderia thailandensis]
MPRRGRIGRRRWQSHGDGNHPPVRERTLAANSQAMNAPRFPAPHPRGATRYMSRSTRFGYSPRCGRTEDGHRRCTPTTRTTPCASSGPGSP